MFFWGGVFSGQKGDTLSRKTYITRGRGSRLVFDSSLLCVNLSVCEVTKLIPTSSQLLNLCSDLLVKAVKQTRRLLKN